MRAGHQQTDIGWHYRQKVDQPIKTENVFEWLVNTKDSEAIFYREDYGKKPFGNEQLLAVLLVNLRDTVHNHYGRTDQNADD